MPGWVDGRSRLTGHRCWPGDPASTGRIGIRHRTEAYPGKPGHPMDRPRQRGDLSVAAATAAVGFIALLDVVVWSAGYVIDTGMLCARGHVRLKVSIT